MRIHPEHGENAVTRHDSTTVDFLVNASLTPPDALVDSLSVKNGRYAGGL